MVLGDGQEETDLFCKVRSGKSAFRSANYYSPLQTPFSSSYWNWEGRISAGPWCSGFGG